ncbi:unnamed protein product [Pleuronectes platessa]|uniref:Uncharacterized protein n=1 Tax=Pleuronectes platessa TaxID=8262 RepID=A0A9N7VLL8_PLEPL|nr:unnamed protein product [Pleuronectes platessa]
MNPLTSSLRLLQESVLESEKQRAEAETAVTTKASFDTTKAVFNETGLLVLLSEPFDISTISHTERCRCLEHLGPLPGRRDAAVSHTNTPQHISEHGRDAPGIDFAR